jgi:hypothetical protein
VLGRGGRSSGDIVFLWGRFVKPCHREIFLAQWLITFIDGSAEVLTVKRQRGTSICIDDAFILVVVSIALFGTGLRWIGVLSPGFFIYSGKLAFVGATGEYRLTGKKIPRFAVQA